MLSEFLSSLPISVPLMKNNQARLDFLLLLFEYRKLIRNGETLAGNAMPPVCWVDVIFTKLGHAIIKVTTEMSLRQNDGCHQELVGSLKKQREQEWLRTAAQLPGSNSIRVLYQVANELAIR